MKKSKVFTQYSKDSLVINVVVNINGNVRAKNQIIYKGNNHKTTKRKSNIKWNKEHRNYKHEWCVNNKEYKKEYDKKYYILNREKKIEHSKIYGKQYRKNNSEKIRKLSNRYRKTPAGKKVQRKSNAERRKFGFNPLNKSFKGCHFHHTHIDENHNDGIHMPAKLHNSIWHSHKDKESMNKINKLAFEWLEKNEISQ